MPGIGLSHGDGQRDDALYFRDMSNIEQLEVVNGPASGSPNLNMPGAPRGVQLTARHAF